MPNSVRRNTGRGRFYDNAYIERLWNAVEELKYNIGIISVWQKTPQQSLN